MKNTSSTADSGGGPLSTTTTEKITPSPKKGTLPPLAVAASPLQLPPYCYSRTVSSPAGVDAALAALEEQQEGGGGGGAEAIPAHQEERKAQLREEAQPAAEAVVVEGEHLLDSKIFLNFIFRESPTEPPDHNRGGSHPASAHPTGPSR